MSRAGLRKLGFVALYAQADLHPYGWQVRHWLNPTTKQHVIEYIPIRPGKCASKEGEDGAVIVANYEEQVAFHRQIGAPIVPPGELWKDGEAEHEQLWLF